MKSSLVHRYEYLLVSDLKPKPYPVRLLADSVFDGEMKNNAYKA